MPRVKSLYRCQDCGHASPKWLGQCPDCSAWNTLAEEVVEAVPAARAAGGGASLADFSSEVTPLAEAAQRERARVPVGLGELDRMLGGGLVEGQVVLLAGPPGIGKSTLMLQAAERLANGGERNGSRSRRTVLYVSGEESLAQVSGRARRLGLSPRDIFLLSETNLARILEAMAKVEPAALILDSVQTIYHPELSGSPGSVGQVRECAAALLRAAKSKDIITFLLGHVTKEGALAGPRVLEHLVDTVLYFDTESHQLLRLLRVHKNRFGPSSEIGLFEMGERGLSEIADAAAFFLSEAKLQALAGRAVSVALEGSRPLVVEVQALVAPTRYPLPRRMTTGLDLNRTLVLIAALEKHLKLRLENHDVFLSLAGGIKQNDPAMDLAVCAALASSARDVPLPADAVFLGEVGLLGQLGRVTFLPQRLKEAAKLGFKRACVPERSVKDAGPAAAAMTVNGFSNVAACAARLVDRKADEEP